MSESGLPALDHTMQDTNIWLKGSAANILTSRRGPTPTVRCVQCGTPCAISLTSDSAVHLGAQCTYPAESIMRGSIRPANQRRIEAFRSSPIVSCSNCRGNFPWTR